MKIKSILFILLFSAAMTACTPVSYYQLYQTASEGKISKGTGKLIFEDEHCKVSYDLWADQGNIGFLFQNKTDKIIELNMENSYFLLNGIALGYFKNRVYTHSNTAGISSSSVVSRGSFVSTSNSILGQVLASRSATISGNSVNSTKGYSESYSEQKVIRIPPHTATIVSEYSIWSFVYRDCGLLRFPYKTEIATIKFSKETSPIVFGNHISYFVDGNQNANAMDNEFYVSEITNYAASEMFEFKYDEYCGQKSAYRKKVFRFYASDRFYLEYPRDSDLMKH